MSNEANDMSIVHNLKSNEKKEDFHTPTKKLIDSAGETANTPAKEEPLPFTDGNTSSSNNMQESVCENVDGGYLIRQVHPIKVGLDREEWLKSFTC